VIELTGIREILRAASFLYWLLAVGALALVLWKVRPWWAATVGAIVIVAAFGYSPLQDVIETSKREAYAREAWAYFKQKCDTEAGEKIYKTFTGVKSVLVVKPLPPATEKDLYDQFWYGDPYSSASKDDRARSAAYSLLATMADKGSKAKVKGFDFVEQYRDVPGPSQSTIRYVLTSVGNVADTSVPGPVSRFGISWEDISTPDDRKYWVAGSRLRVLDLTDNSLLAERVGFFIEAGFGSTAGQRRPWLTSRGPNTTCPRIESSFDEDRFFIQKVLSPVGGEDGK